MLRRLALTAEPPFRALVLCRSSASLASLGDLIFVEQRLKLFVAYA